MLIWYSKEFKNAFPEKVKNLKNNSIKSISTDFFYHSILDLIEIENFNYQKEKSVISDGIFLN